jgi:hypothetical protein
MLRERFEAELAAKGTITVSSGARNRDGGGVLGVYA